MTRTVLVALALAFTVGGGCVKDAPPSSSGGAAPHAVRFVDVDAAFASAKAGGKVVFVDGWAPWCHTCLSMQRDVLRDVALARYEDRVVFAEVDTDRPEAAPFVARFPLRGWPTFFVIDPVADAALAVHAGSLSLVELTAFLDEALRTRDPAAAAEPQVKELLLGHAAMGKRDYASAAAHYVAAAGLPGKRVPEAALGAMRAFTGAKDDHGCLAFGLPELGAFTTSSSTADFVSYVITCAEDLDEKDPLRAKAIAAARATLEPLTASPPAGASVDDKADALAMLADVAEEQHDDVGRRTAHEKRLALLVADAGAQKNVEDARVQDYARLNSYLALGRGDEAVKMLQERTAQLPTSYEAFARLASAFHQLKREDDAIPAAKKAIELSYGPRRLRYRTLLADVYAAKKDAAGERAAVLALVKDAEAMPPGQKDDAAIASARARLAKLDAAGAASTAR